MSLVSVEQNEDAAPTKGKKDKKDKKAERQSILDKIKANSTIDDSSVLSSSIFFTEKDMISTAIPAINIALSGRLDGGMVPGFTMWAGPSKHFKTLFTLIMAKAYMDKYPDAAMLFYDSEFGTPISYFDSLGFDKSRILHSPLTDIEQLKFDVMNQLASVERGDHLVIVIDSIGSLASKKEVEDALVGKSVADMTRAKALKSLFRMITPHLMIKDIPMIAVNHTYQTLETYSKAIVGGGTGSYYSADNIFVVGRRQATEGSGENKEMVGYEFVINIEKSRYVREKSKIVITVKFEGGLSPWTGMMEMAWDAGLVVKPKNGWYSRVDPATGEVEEKLWRLKDTDTKEFWLPIVTSDVFGTWVRSTYELAHAKLISDDSEEEIIEELDNE